MIATIEDYNKVIPYKLLNQVDSLISYLSHYPFQLPDSCKHCGSKNFTERKYKRPNSKRNIAIFSCQSCKRRFSQTTNSHFAGIIYLELLGDYAKLRLSGYSQEVISHKLGFSLATARDRDKLFLSIMAEKYPKLYAWWKPHQDFIDTKLSTQVKKERDLFIKWLKTYLNKKQITCPSCYQEATVQGNYLFVCKQCEFEFKQEITYDGRTPKEYLDKWIPFVEGLIQGKSGYALAREFNLSKRTASDWKQKFTHQIHQFKLNKLIQWITWQRSRGVAYQARQSRIS